MRQSELQTRLALGRQSVSNQIRSVGKAGGRTVNPPYTLQAIAITLLNEEQKKLISFRSLKTPAVGIEVSASGTHWSDGNKSESFIAAVSFPHK